MKHLKNIISLPQYSVLRLIKKFSYTGKKYEKVYLPVISQYIGGNFKVISIKDNNVIISKITEIGLFIFDDREIAIEFAELIGSYFLSQERNCKTGQKFWPRFRELLVKAINHKELENIHKSRVYLDKAIFELEGKVRSKKKTPKEYQISTDKIFYPKG